MIASCRSSSAQSAHSGGKAIDGDSATQDIGSNHHEGGSMDRPGAASSACAREHVSSSSSPNAQSSQSLRVAIYDTLVTVGSL